MDGFTKTWHGGEHRFLLEIGQLRALQDKCDAGPQFILGRLSGTEWRIDDVVQTVRLGLEGGGLDSIDARKLVEEHIEQRHAWLEHVALAAAILMYALVGEEDEPVGESLAGTEDQDQSRSRGENGDGPPSTDPAQP